MSMRRLLLTVLSAVLCAMLALPWAAVAGQESPYRIEVDVGNQITTVYSCADDAVVRQMICSTGTGDRTPRGTFHLASRAADRAEWYFIGKYQCYVKYPTRIQGSILFHSLPYLDRDMAAVDAQAFAQLGSKASHGCVRLRWEDAQWIALNCPDGTETRIFTAASRREALRQLLLEQSYSADSGVSYERFTRDAREAAPDALLYGAEGEAVEALQRRLGALGYFEGPLTGVYDAATVMAVKRFQSAWGFVDTGVATPALIERIESPGPPVDDSH